jgi:hypothetical protein
MTMARHPLRAVRSTQGPSDTAATPLDGFRDNLAERYPGLDQTCPAALDLAALLHSALHRRLTGVASQFAGRRSPAHFREALRAERDLNLVDVAFLAVQPMAEPRAGIAALVSDLAHEVDCRVTPDGHEGVTVSGSLVYLLQTFGVSLAAVEKARADGKIDSEERPNVIAALEELQRHVGDVLEAVRETGERA